MPERIDHLIRRKRLVGQREQEALVEQSQDLAEQPTRQFRTVGHQLVGVDAEIADVVAERAQADARVLIEVALAQLEESSKGLQDAEVAVDRFASEGVQHDIHSLAPGDRQDLVREGEVT